MTARIQRGGTAWYGFIEVPDSDLTVVAVLPRAGGGTWEALHGRRPGRIEALPSCFQLSEAAREALSAALVHYIRSHCRECGSTLFEQHGFRFCSDWQCPYNKTVHP